ncbi:MAG: nucleotidyltransferase domain-containing protein [Alphaproteobacteria bacterium]|nr:nucleotidyltransferase domain-containing protein [Alphaproteobacteria bacterium]
MMQTNIPEEFKRRAQVALPGRVERVVLFGSRARGDSGPESDWDMAVFLKGGADSRDLCALADAAYDMILETGEFIQPVAFPADQPVSDLSILRNIERQGVAV